MKVVTIIQARTSSNRLRNKVLMDINGKSLLNRVIDQTLKIKKSDSVWVATSTDPSDEGIELVCQARGTKCFRGSLDNVRSRFYEIAKEEKVDIIVRVTADNPFIEPEYADQMIECLEQNQHIDYVRMKKVSILDGTGSEVFTMNAFEQAVQQFQTPSDTEHVTASLIVNFKIAELEPDNNILKANHPYFLGVDTMEDYLTSVKLFQKYGEQEPLQSIIKKVNSHETVI